MSKITNLYARDYLIKKCLFKTASGESCSDESWNSLILHPKDNLLLLDADKFLIPDSLKYIEEETLRIDPSLTHENILTINDTIRQIKGEINRVAGENIADCDVIRLNTWWYYKKGNEPNLRYEPLKSLELVNLFKAKKDYENQLKDYYIRKDFIVEEVDPAGPRLNYEYIYNSSHVDEQACNMANLCAKDGTYKYVLVVSYSNSHKTESIYKDDLLSRNLAPEIKRLYIPYHLAPFFKENKDGGDGIIVNGSGDINYPREATNKPVVVEKIFGEFDSSLSTFHDDSGFACAIAKASYPEMDCIRLVDGGSAAENIRVGRQKVLEKKLVN